MAAVQQMRERMTGIHSQWREHWKNFLQKITVRPRRAFCRQLRDFAHVNPVLRQLRQQFIFPKRILRRNQVTHRFLDAIEYFRGAQPVRANVARLALNLLFDSGDANLEELVQIRTDDGEKLNPLDERLPLILRFFENAAVELEPAQLAIDEIFVVAKPIMRGLYDLWSGDRAAFLFDSSSGFRHLPTSAINCAYAMPAAQTAAATV